MRSILVPLLLAFLAVGCSRKNSEEATDTGKPAARAHPETVDEARTRLLTQLKIPSEKGRLDAVEELSAWAETDAPTVDALIAFLSDESTAGAGKTHPTRITSTREAAARALSLAGPRGEAALREKGFATLRKGLTDPRPAIREHTAHTIGLLGAVARPLSSDVMKLCTDTDPHVRGVAFDALRSIGVTDVAGFVLLLNHENGEVGRLASEFVPAFDAVPESAIQALVSALKNDSEPIRIAAAEGLAISRANSPAAMESLAEVIRKSYPAEYDPDAMVVLGPEMAYWRALAKIGEPGLNATAELLGHSNALVRALAARTLGELRAKSAVPKLKEALKDRYGFVAVEAACALSRMEEATDDAVDLVKRALDAPNNVAETAIEAIPRMGTAGKPLVGVALAKLTSDNPYARHAAIGLVGTLPPEDGMKHAAELGRLTADEHTEIRARAAFVIEKLGPAGSAAAEALAMALTTEKDESLRDRYVDALIAMGPGAKTALPALLPLASDQGLPVGRRERVIAAIAAADPSSAEVAKTLLAVAADPDPSLRAAAATALGRLDPIPPEATAKLAALAKSDKRTDPRAAALRALARAGPRAQSVREEIAAIAAGRIQDGLALLAKIAIAAMDGDLAGSAAVVRAGLTDKKADLRAAAVRALLDIGPKKEDLPALLKLVRDRDGTTREAAVLCLGKLGSVAVDGLPHFVKLLTEDAVAEVRIAAATALGEIGPAAQSAIPKLRQAVRDDRIAESAARKALEKLGEKEKRR